jgi:membrane-associated protein
VRTLGSRIWLAVAALALAVAVVAVLFTIDDGDGLGLIEGGQSLSYAMVFLLIAGDAVLPIFPGETTLNAAATLAAQDQLRLGLVILAGALGAIVGDSTLFLLARRSSARMKPKMDRAMRNPRIAAAFAYLDRGAPVLLVFGRYVPGLRFVINTTMGLSDRPYREFIPWSALGGVMWSAYTCLLAYWVGSKLDDYPLASVYISGAITTLLMAGFYFAERRRRKRSATPAGSRPKGESKDATPA